MRAFPVLLTLLACARASASCDTVTLVAVGKQRDGFVRAWIRQLGWNESCVVLQHAEPSSHGVGESLAFYQFVASHYHRLPQQLAVVGDAHPTHWHRDVDFRLLPRSASRTMCVHGGQAGDDNLRLRTGPSERCEKKATLDAFRVRGYDPELLSNQIGNDFTVSRRALRTFPRSSYQAIAKAIAAQICKPTDNFGYALDRLKTVLFDEAVRRARNWPPFRWPRNKTGGTTCAF